MATQYKFRPGTRIKGVKAEDAAAELERIRGTDGLTADAVVTAASEPSSPLHPAFEWDDTKAAHEHRLSQARGLIRAVVIVKEGQPASPVYVHVTTDDVNGYQPVSVVVQSPTLFQVALNGLLGHLAAARKAVADLRRLSPNSEKVGAVERILAEADEVVKSAA